jgi:hypothetical protein
MLIELSRNAIETRFQILSYGELNSQCSDFLGFTSVLYACIILLFIAQPEAGVSNLYCEGPQRHCGLIRGPHV